MTTIRDVADRAQVSITTVSHVINGTRFVSDDLTKRVQDAMQDLQYRPNTLARSLRSGRTRTIGLVVPDISNLFFAEIARKIEDHGFANDYSVILCNTDDDLDKEASYIDVLMEKQVDGVIFISSGGDEENLAQLLDFEIPIVIADRDIEHIDADIVLVNNKEGGYQAANYLIALGHEKIGCIGGPSLVTPSSLRVAGYQQALQDHGIPLRNELIINGNFRFDGGEKAMRLLLGLEETPTAVFATNDMMALGALRAIYDHGLSVPDDISVIGFDDIPISSSVYPALTTFAQPIKGMAEIVVNLLVSRIKHASRRDKEQNSENTYQRLVLDVQLIERDSCQKNKEKMKGDV